VTETRPTKALKLHPEAEQIPPMLPDEWRAFRDDIAERGIQVPIEIMPDWTILDGRHRWRAAQELGLEEVPVRVVNSPDPIAYMTKAAVLRRHLTTGQRAALAVLYLPKLEEEAKGRQGERRDLNIVEIIPQCEPTRSRDQAAEIFGVNSHYVSDAKRLQQEAPDVFEQVKAGTMTLPEAKQERKKRDRAAMLEQPKPTLPEGRYRVICADPPWQYSNSGFTQSAASQYPTMSTEEICALPISDLCEPDTVLFLWATSPLLPEAFQVLEAWGFTYKASMVWDKTKAPGIGWFVETQHELLLIATREDNPHPKNKFPSVYREASTTHSTKPIHYYEIIEAMYDGPYIELFARHPRDGWQSFGNEV